jgi:hypothetical protein
VKPSFVPAVLLACALPICAQTTGTSNPEQLDDTITAPQSQSPAYAPAKPSPDVPLDQSPAAYPNGQVQEYQPQPSADHYVKPNHDGAAPYQGASTPYPASSSGSQVIHQPVSSLPLNEQLADPGVSSAPPPASAPSTPAGNSGYGDGYGPYRPYTPTTTTAVQSTGPELKRHPSDYADPTIDDRGHPRQSFTVTDDPTSGVVMDVPAGPNELPAATLLRARLMSFLSTRITKPGDLFTAALAADVVRNSRVLLPAGSTIHGRITAAHNGKGITTASVLRLEATSITLPDGSTYPLHAEVVDLNHVAGSHVTAEGAIVDNAMTRGQAAKLGATTGGGAVAGALVGGGVGAAVGATIGAGVGTVLYLRRDREQTIPANAELVFALDTSLDLTPAAHAERF